ncbi:MAG: polyprenyl synthetase family protein [Victivallaceae bacterium]|nr:polyprenyl synthetase family protein [Victivallaceae bacterium]
MKSAPELFAAVAEAVEHLAATDEFPSHVRPEFLGRAMRDYPLRGGKRLRPILFTLFREACRPGCAMIAEVATALEIWHNWTLVHDDIIDEDTLRRGKKVCHLLLEEEAIAHEATGDAAKKFGRDFAILCGDLQQSWAFSLLARSPLPGEMRAALTNRFAVGGGAGVISGEALDILYSCEGGNFARARESGTVSPEDVLHMYERKTGELFALSAECAVATILDDPQFASPLVKDAREFSLNAGVAFQLADDLLGIYGDAQFGKDLGSDFREGKLTYPLTAALSDAATAPELRTFLHRDHYDAKTLERIRFLMESSGAKSKSEQVAQDCQMRAREALSHFPENTARTALETLLTGMTDRRK